MRRISRFIAVLTGIFIFCLSATPATAADDGQVGYNIQAVIPANQVDKGSSFFDLRMKPGQQQTIEVAVNNTSEEEASFDVNVNQAYTNAQGFIDYSDANVSPDKSLKYNIQDIASYDKEVTVAAQSSKLIAIDLQMPKDSFDGEILAGIQVAKQASPDESKGKITNTYGYILGLKLTETDAAVKRELKLLSVKPAASFGKTSIVAKLQNPTADAFGHLKYAVKVTKKGTDDVARDVTYDDDMQMAPNSTYDFAIDWGGKALAAGDYTLKLTVSDAKSNVWRFNKDFTITRKAAKEVNDVTVNKVNQQKLPTWALILLGVLTALLLLLLILVFLERNKRGSQKENRRKR